SRIESLHDLLLLIDLVRLVAHRRVKGLDVPLHVIHLGVEANVILEDEGDVDYRHARAGDDRRTSGGGRTSSWTWRASGLLAGSGSHQNEDRQRPRHERGAHRGKSHAKHSLLFGWSS